MVIYLLKIEIIWFIIKLLQLFSLKKRYIIILIQLLYYNK